MLRLGATLGDPAGIGPEILLKAANRVPHDIVVFGRRDLLDETADRLGLTRFEGDVVDVLPTAESVSPGQPTRYCAALQHAALVAAIDAALSGSIDAIVTAPWTKRILPLAGLPATGHTEVLAQRCGVERPTMLLAGDVLRVALATVHVPISEVPELLSTERVLGHLITLDAELRARFAISAPRIAVCGLNPHAGEGGLMGVEDAAVITPAVEAAKARGIDADGPFPADTLFPRVARRGSHDAVLAMYHDQGLAPLKLWHFGEAANVTLGLPIIRTSVDHGTAYDIAGRGVADEGSLIYAFEMAARLAANQKRAVGSNST